MRVIRLLTTICGLIIFCIFLFPQITCSQQMAESEIEKLASQIDSSNKKERREALEKLDKFGELLSEEKIKMALVKLLAKEVEKEKSHISNDTHDRPEYMLHILEYIYKMKDIRTIPYLVEIIGKSNVPGIVLSEIGEPAIEPVIQKISKGTTNERAGAVSTLGMMIKIKEPKYPISNNSREKIKHILIKTSKEQGQWVRTAAVRGLGEMASQGDTDVIPLIEKLAKEDPYFEDFSKDPHSKVSKRYKVREEAQKVLEKLKKEGKIKE